MKIPFITLLALCIACISAAPLTEIRSEVMQKREDSADRKQDAAVGGALRGFVLPGLGGGTFSPLGGQPPDED
jgi:hypothetical protein